MSNRYRIAIFIDWFEPGFKGGGPIRSVANFVQHLSDTYELYIITSDRDIGESKPYEGILTNRWIDRDKYKILYAAPGMLGMQSIRKMLRQVSPDWIYLNGMFSWTYSILPILVRSLFYRQASVLLAPRGMLKESALQFKQRKKVTFLAIFKAVYTRRDIIFQATDSAEQRDITSVFGNSARVVSLPNFPGRQNEFKPVTNKKVGEIKMILISRVHPIKNLSYVLSILPELSVKVNLTIVGAIEDRVYWEHCKQLMARIDTESSVTVIEDVPHAQLEKMILQHHLFILPTLGENFGHAIFEALAAGRPVLISDQTPWRNLSVRKAGWDVPLSEPNKFKEVINNVGGMDLNELNIWCKGAWMYCHDYLADSTLKNSYTRFFATKQQ